MSTSNRFAWRLNSTLWFYLGEVYDIAKLAGAVALGIIIGSKFV